MTYPDDPAANDVQRKAPYPANFIVAVKPEDVNKAGCRHEIGLPICTCVHDWRIEWSNVERKADPVARYVTDSP